MNKNPPFRLQVLWILEHRIPTEMLHLLIFFCQQVVTSVEKRNHLTRALFFSINDFLGAFKTCRSESMILPEGLGNKYRQIHTNSTFPNKTSWWFQPIWKICSSNWVPLPQVGVKIKIFELPPPRKVCLDFVVLKTISVWKKRHQLLRLAWPRLWLAMQGFAQRQDVVVVALHLFLATFGLPGLMEDSEKSAEIGLMIWFLCGDSFFFRLYYHQYLS